MLQCFIAAFKLFSFMEFLLFPVAKHTSAHTESYSYRFIVKANLVSWMYHVLVMTNRAEKIENLASTRCRGSTPASSLLRIRSKSRSTVLVYASSLSGARVYQFVE